MDKSALEALDGFVRFPRWMWRNNVMVGFLDWLKRYNSFLQQELKIGFYGLDLYCINEAREQGLLKEIPIEYCYDTSQVIQYLEKHDKEAARKAREAYSCFDESGVSPNRYGYAIAKGIQRSCQQECVSMFFQMLNKLQQVMNDESQVAQIERQFYATISAKVIKNSEEYYRQMFFEEFGNSTWNIRDKHMTEVLADLVRFWDNSHPNGPKGKAIVWAHNSHLGDAKATESTKRGEINVGQLTRELFGLGNTYNIGFSTFNGTVTAAHSWGAVPQFMVVRDALEGSVECLFHEITIANEFQHKNFMILFRTNDPSQAPVNDHLVQALSKKELLERAIGVIYAPKTERWSHYFYVNLPIQFDAIIHLDETRALLPLETSPQWKKGAADFSETYPFGV